MLESVPWFKEIRIRFVEEMKTLSGIPLQDAIDRFILEFSDMSKCSASLALSVTVMLLSQFRDKKFRGKPGYRVSRRTVAFWGFYFWMEDAELDEGIVVLHNARKPKGVEIRSEPIANSPGLRRISTVSEGWMTHTASAMIAMIQFVAPAKPMDLDPMKLRDELMIDGREGHKMIMQRNADAIEWMEDAQADFEQLYYTARASNKAYLIPTQEELAANLISALTSDHWVVIERRLESADRCADDLTFGEITRLVEEAQATLDSRKKNREVRKKMKPGGDAIKHAPAPAPAATAEGEGGGSSKKGKKKGKKADEDVSFPTPNAPTTPPKEHEERWDKEKLLEVRSKLTCRDWKEGTCTRGEECHYAHADIKKVNEIVTPAGAPAEGDVKNVSTVNKIETTIDSDDEDFEIERITIPIKWGNKSCSVIMTGNSDATEGEAASPWCYCAEAEVGDNCHGCFKCLYCCCCGQDTEVTEKSTLMLVTEPDLEIDTAELTHVDKPVTCYRASQPIPSIEDNGEETEDDSVWCYCSAADQGNTCQTCGMCFYCCSCKSVAYSLCERDSEADDIQPDNNPFNAIDESSSEEEDEVDDEQELSPGQVAFEARMKAKFHTKSEVAGLLQAGAILFGSHEKRGARSRPRQDWEEAPFVQPEQSNLFLSDVLQSERDAALVDEDVGLDDSIDLESDPDEEMEFQRGQHPISMFLVKRPVYVEQNMDEDVPELIEGVEPIANPIVCSDMQAQYVQPGDLPSPHLSGSSREARDKLAAKINGKFKTAAEAKAFTSTLLNVKQCLHLSPSNYPATPTTSTHFVTGGELFRQPDDEDSDLDSDDSDEEMSPVEVKVENIEIPAAEEEDIEFFALSTYSDMMGLCFCQAGQFEGMCEECEQCSECCNCEVRFTTPTRPEYATDSYFQ